MATVFPLPLAKPEFGAPCNGCGICCKTQVCELSIEYVGSHKAPCSALEEEDGQYRCGLLANPVKYLAPQMAGEAEAVAFGRRELSPKFAFMLGIGAGCDSTDPG